MKNYEAPVTEMFEIEMTSDLMSSAGGQSTPGQSTTGSGDDGEEGGSW